MKIKAATRRKAGKVDPMTGRLIVTECRQGSDPQETSTIRSLQALSLLAELREQMVTLAESGSKDDAVWLGHAVQELLELRNTMKGFKP